MLGDEWKKMEVVQLQSIKLAGCHQGNQVNCAVKLSFNEKLNSDPQFTKRALPFKTLQLFSYGSQMLRT